MNGWGLLQTVVTSALTFFALPEFDGEDLRPHEWYVRRATRARGP
jgi:hypothetical protein